MEKTQSKPEQRKEKDREEVAKMLYRTLSVNHPHVTIEDCYQLYDEMIASVKNKSR